jgi:hypothetical protein
MNIEISWWVEFSSPGHYHISRVVPHPPKIILYSSKSFTPSLFDLTFYLSRLSYCLVDFPICLVNENSFLVDSTSSLLNLTPCGLSGLSISWHQGLVYSYSQVYPLSFQGRLPYIWVLYLFFGQPYVSLGNWFMYCLT